MRISARSVQAGVLDAVHALANRGHQLGLDLGVAPLG